MCAAVGMYTAPGPGLAILLPGAANPRLSSGDIACGLLRGPVAAIMGPSLRTYEMICHYFTGLAEEDELLAHLAKLQNQDA